MSEYKITCWNIHDFVSESGDLLTLDVILEMPEFFHLGLTSRPVDLLISSEGPDGRPLEHAKLCNSLVDNGDDFRPGTQILPVATVQLANGASGSLVVGQFLRPDNTLSGIHIFSTGALTAGQVFEIADVSIHGASIGKAMFSRGTMIDTPHGAVPIEQLESGDEIVANDGSMQLINATARNRFSGLELALDPALVPLRIRAGALTGGRPGQDLIVSQNHRLVVDDWRAAYLFGEDEILVPAKSLLNNRSVAIEDHRGGVEYFELAIQGNSLVCANGLWAETSCELGTEQDETANTDGRLSRPAMAALPHATVVALVA